MAYEDEHADNSWILRVRLASAGGRVLSQEKVLQSPEMGEARLSPDGTHIAYSSNLSGADNIWSSDADGHNSIQLTSFSGELAGSPGWSPEGTWLVIDRRPGDHAQIVVIDAEGRNMHALTDGEYENMVPIWSRDGKAVYFASNRTGKYELWKQDIASAVPTQVTRHGGFSGVESYDGRYLYFVKRFCSGIWRLPIDGGEEEQITNLPESWYSRYWDIAERGIYCYDIGATPRPAVKFYDFNSRQTTTVLEPEGQAMEWSMESASRATDALYYIVRVIRPRRSWSRTKSVEFNAISHTDSLRNFLPRVNCRERANHSSVAAYTRCPGLIP